MKGGQDGHVGQVGQDRRGSLWSALSILSVLSLAATACTETGVKPTVTLQQADTADQLLEGMSHYITEKGVRRSLVEADTARLYEPTQIAEMRAVTVTFYDSVGKVTSVVTADSGTYFMRDGSMKARGNVIARTPDGRRLSSPVLNYDQKSNTISSDQPFTYENGEEHLQGNGFHSDPDFRNVVTQQPRGGQKEVRKGKPSGGVLLPGQ
ncbi:MAG TPA: LPS export ABC transporter periplasmic protein LptC [Gemmatimonadales bacterium]|jgi:LPS export ABC transporter protein LptC|nr:LPS export ABC transporter periplasmic protein LptC [Gemmatimonadales bacterium]